MQWIFLALSIVLLIVAVVHMPRGLFASGCMLVLSGCLLAEFELLSRNFLLTTAIAIIGSFVVGMAYTQETS